MAADLIPDELARAVRRYGFAYLVTVGTDMRTHVAPVTPSIGHGELRVTGLGRRTLGNLADRPTITLVWPPSDGGEYSLILDGIGSPDGDEVTVAPVRAVLHRPAEEPATGSAGGCAADCIELPVR